MAIELVTGKAGVPHVDSEDVGAFNAYSLGSGAYIMSGCEVTAKSANSINIAAGEILWEGRHIRVKGSGEGLAVDNGQTGYNRRDLITLNYAKDSNGIESAYFKVVKGAATTGTAADPSVKVGSILAGDTSAVIPFARIALSGLSVATPTVLLGSLPSLASLRDSVSPIQIRGWKVLTSAKTSGTPGITNSKILMAYEGTDKSWTFIPIMTRWCTVESIDPKSSGISLTVNPTYDSSNIQVSLLAIKFSQ